MSCFAFETAFSSRWTLFSISVIPSITASYSPPSAGVVSMVNPLYSIFISISNSYPGVLPAWKELENDMKIEYRGLTIETTPADGGLYDAVIDGITDILKSVQREEKAVSNAKQLIDIFLQDLGLGRN